MQLTLHHLQLTRDIFPIMREPEILSDLIDIMSEDILKSGKVIYILYIHTL